MNSKDFMQASSDLREEWRILCMVFALVTAKNHGKPKLKYVAHDGDNLLEENRRAIDQRLFNLAPLFPRDTEVLASAMRMPTTQVPHASVVSVADSELPTFHGYAASLANPDARHVKAEQRNKTNKTAIRLAPKGFSYWDVIKKSRYQEIARMRFEKDGALADYMATLAHFFRDQQAEMDQLTRNEQFYKCLRYVTVCCWRKMYRRMDNWISMGFIYQIAVLSPSLVNAVDKASESQAATVPDASVKKPRTDEKLYTLLNLLAPGVIQQVMEQFRPSPDPQLDNLDNLMAALELKRKSGDWHSSAHNKDTCHEFHHFLIALLLGYGRLLCRLDKSHADEGEKREANLRAMAATRKEEAINRKKEIAKANREKQGKGKDKGKGKGQEKDKAPVQTKGKISQVTVQDGILLDSLCTYSRLLWTVVSSRLFKDHLNVIAPLFTVPDADHANEYKEWANFGSRIKTGGKTGGIGADEAGERGDNGGASDDAEGVGDDDMDRCDNDVNEQMAQSAPAGAPIGTLMAWVKLNTSHFTALEETSKYSLSQIDFPLIELMPPLNNARDPMDWHKFVTNFIQRMPKQDPEVVINRLQKVIDSDEYDICRSFGVPESVATARKLKVGQVLSSANWHCEMGLAALKTWPPPSEWEVPKDVLDILDALDISAIAVSKLCCPICWVFLKLVRGGDANACLVFGHHTCFYPVELPDWLPEKIVQKMVDIFSDFLEAEMFIFMGDKAKTHKYSISGRSVMSMSSVRSVRDMQTTSEIEGSSGVVLLPKY